MPANITHMLIAHKALQTLKCKGIKEYTDFANLLDTNTRRENYKAYLNLGSLGPDLYYYMNLAGSVKDMITEGFVQAKGVTPWAYHLHAQRPNEFPLRLMEVIFSDAIWKRGKVQLQRDDYRKIAYVAGHLTHIAADQIIHPLVNGVAGPYYRSGENRKTHRQCEVFQDYFLYTQVYRLEEKTGSKYDFFKQDFRKWADCIRGATFKNAEDWFRYFLQRGFLETYSGCPTEDQIENSVDNLLLTLRVCQKVGPYKKADKAYQQNKEKSKMYIEYIKKINYLKYYRLAIELVVVYLIALYEVFSILEKGQDFSKKHKNRFLKIVSDADLSCPLQQNILAKATKALKNKTTMDTKVDTAVLVANTKLVTEKAIFKAVNEKEILKV